MGFERIIQAGLRTAKAVTTSLRAPVTHERLLDVDGFGKPNYADPVVLTAIVERVQRLMRNAYGQEVMASHRLLFVEPVPIDPRDKLTLSDGTTAPIISVQGVFDPSTDAPYYAEVFIGAGSGVSTDRRVGA